MKFLTLATLLATASATAFANPLEKRTNQKANEYASQDCSGPVNYGHVGQAGTSLVSVNMDPTSNSVYLAGATWHGFTERNPDGNGNGCSGTNFGELGGACQNLNSALAGGRINCVAT